MSEQYEPNKLYAVERFTWERVVRRTCMKPVALKALALILATYADAETGKRIHPGVARLSDELGQDERTIRRNLEVLEKVGLVYKLTQGSTFGRRGGMASEYQLCAPGSALEHLEVVPDDLLLYAQDILAGHDPGFSTWIERNPHQPRKPREAKVISLIRTPDIPTGTPDIQDKTPDIPSRTPDIPDGTPGAGARPSTISTNHSSSNQPASNQPASASTSLREADKHEWEADDWDPYSSVRLPADIEAEMNRQANALRNKYPQESW